MSDRSFLDWPFFEPHHRELAQQLDQWCQERLEPLLQAHADHDSHEALDTACRAILQALAEDGWIRYAVPKAYGGVHESLDVRSLCLIRETLARYAGLADFMFAMQGLGSGTITLYGTEAQKQQYLPDVAAGRKIAAFALTELETGSDVAAMKSDALLQGDHYLLNGAKTFISNGGIADFYVSILRTGEAAGSRGLSAFIVDADSPGFSIRERLDVIAPHPLATIDYQDCKIPVSQLLGEPGQGFKAAMATLDIFRTTVGAAALGFARCALDEATHHSSSRMLFNAPLSDLQLVQAMLADSALDVDASALLIYRAAWTRDVRGERVTREAAMAKLHATEQAQKVIDRAVQIHGGGGVLRGNKVEELYREIRALRIYEGATEVQKVVIARQHLMRELG
ncbi:acyl-CoA dehydrogenase family protein [Nitrincola sp. MINF-07-Sa-05]|uniref:acyl-CoA dehydrogenase family protein n=1 Tax=Nitrincola salilacus TaxID=3400273 RepID=UPI003917FF6E